MADELFNDVLDSEAMLGERVPDTALEIVRWWEWKRRLIYNGVVLLSGLPALVIALSFWSELMLRPEDFVILVVMYAVAANACYTIGWVLELLLMVYFKLRQGFGKFRLVVYIIGCVFSAGVTIVPMLGLGLIFTVFG